jgi:hypothetical protein
MTRTSFHQLLPTPPNLFQRRSINLQATTTPTLGDNNNDNNNDTKNETLERKVEGRKKRVILGYRIVMIQFLVTTLLFVASRGGVKERPPTPAFVAYWTSGPLLVAGVSHILRGAAQYDRLSSETYKRLNLFLAAYGILSLSMALLAPETFRGPLFIVPPLFATVNAIKGYGYGVLGWDKKKKKSSSGRSILQSDLWNGCQETIKSLFSLPKRSTTTTRNDAASSLAKSIGYLVATWVVTLLAVGKAWDIVQLLAGGGAAAGAASTKILIASRCSRLARFTLLSSILYTLKDAADRNRLTGTTFIQLNALSSWAFATMAGTFLFTSVAFCLIFVVMCVLCRALPYILPLLFCGAPGISWIPTIFDVFLACLLAFFLSCRVDLRIAYLGWTTQWGLVAGFFAIFTAGNGLLSNWEKKQKP